MERYIKDDDGTLDFKFNWTDWLAEGETITDFVITAQTGITLETLAPYIQSESGGVVTYWLSGGTPGNWYSVACLIETSKERIDERTMLIKIEER